MSPSDRIYPNVSNFALLKHLKIMQNPGQKCKPDSKNTVLLLSLILPKVLYTGVLRAELKTNDSRLT